VPLQRPLAMGAAPAPEMLAGVQHPAMPERPEGLPAGSLQVTNISSAESGAHAAPGGWGGRSWGLEMVVRGALLVRKRCG
jgi:hypothetical protein